jgi:hypothetical protein
VFQDKEVLVAADIVSPVALAHLAKYMMGATIGYDTCRWTEYYPPPLMVERFLRKCEYMGTLVRVFNYQAGKRPDLDALLTTSDVIVDLCASDCNKNNE